MENKNKTELLKLKVDIMETLLEMAIENNDPKVQDLIIKLQDLIK